MCLNLIRRAKFKLLPLLVIVAIFSCIKNDEFQSDGINIQVKILGIKDSTQTKTALNGLSTTWIANSDKIGIFSPQCRLTTDGEPGVSNAIFTALTDGATSSFSGEIYWGTEASDFYSYYPHQVGEFSYNQVPVSIPAEQTQSAGNNSSHLGNLDFLVSKPVTGLRRGKTAEGASVSLNFNHLFTLLEFQIINTSSSVNISKIRLKGSNPLSFGSGKLDLSQSAPAAGAPYTIDEVAGENNEVMLNITTPFATTDNYNTTPKAYMVIMPGVQMGELKIQIEIDGSFKEIKKAAITFERGKKYTVKIDAALATVPLIDGSELEPVLINGLLWAPVNAGYDSFHPHGLLYQWHRKYGQGQDYSFTPNLTIQLGPKELSVGNAIENKDLFIRVNNLSPYDWTTPQQSNWIMSDDYNPCESGWRVPTQSELQSLIAQGRTVVPSNSGGVDGIPGVWFGPDHNNPSQRTITSIFLPLGGYRNFDSNVEKSTNINLHGFYWTTSVNTSNANGALIYSTSTSPSINSYSRARGHSIRCVKPLLPELIVSNEVEYNNNIATVQCNVIIEGQSNVFERGIVYSKSENPTVNDYKIINGASGGLYSTQINSLIEGEHYYVRGYAINSFGVSYSNQVGMGLSPVYPGTNTKATFLNGIWWAPVNAGYINDTLPNGLYYQWHRKYGQLSNSQLIASTTTLEEANSTEKSAIFYGNSIWCSSALAAPWDINLYNPCPSEWRLPTSSEFQAIVATGRIAGSGPDGQPGFWFLNNSIFLPHAGYRHPAGSMVSSTTQGYYWTNSKIYFPTHSIVVSTSTIGFGMSIRCVKDAN
ncbi:MAG: hypothetical protein A2X19_00070 [Bacteroidetes bacterium GWE2_39_28]|nr:MAG: hypothetical protein A2X19_00070 [Bacteroidetes bacterium GWE2_39_28]OFZ10285.1 MAG: hypothetical protein A2465_03330 [Bacteroidetes bacterium RIFOXYC2_FULL_39_11]